MRKRGVQRRRLLDSDVLGSPPLVGLSLVRELREVNVQVTVAVTRLLEMAFLLLFEWTSLLVDWRPIFISLALDRAELGRREVARGLELLAFLVTTFH